MEPKKVFLLPGEYCVTKRPSLVTTLLGSCVAVILFNKKLKFGGINHYMLSNTPDSVSNSTKYGDYSTEMMIKFMEKEDHNLANLEAMLFGGGHVVGHLNCGDGIAKDNIQIARSILKRHGIRIIKEDVGGTNGRKIYYQSWDNLVTVNTIQKSLYMKEAEIKLKYLSKNKIRLLIVDDSSLVRKIIRQFVMDDPEIEVVAEAADPFEAREKILEYDPDVITLDIIMPRMDGISFLKRIMLYKPLPVIIISTIAQKGSFQSLRAGRIGAFAVYDKENLNLYQSGNEAQCNLIRKIKIAARTPIEKKAIEDLKDL